MSHFLHLTKLFLSNILNKRIILNSFFNYGVFWQGHAASVLQTVSAAYSLSFIKENDTTAAPVLIPGALGVQILRIIMQINYMASVVVAKVNREIIDRQK